MNTAMIVLAAAAAFAGALMAADSEQAVIREILALDRQALDGWTKGNPDGDLSISDPSMTLFHLPNDKRLDGFPAVREFYEKYRGISVCDSYEIVEPKVQVSGDIAVLTFLFDARKGDVTTRYYSTQVWQHKKDGWRIIHAHWSKARTQ